MFNPVGEVSEKEEEQFVISRQYRSPIVSEEDIGEVVMARQNAHLMEVRLS